MILLIISNIPAVNSRGDASLLKCGCSAEMGGLPKILFINPVTFVVATIKRFEPAPACACAWKPELYGKRGIETLLHIQKNFHHEKKQFLENSEKLEAEVGTVIPKSNFYNFDIEVKKVFNSTTQATVQSIFVYATPKVNRVPPLDDYAIRGWVGVKSFDEKAETYSMLLCQSQEPTEIKLSEPSFTGEVFVCPVGADSMR